MKRHNLDIILAALPIGSTGSQRMGDALDVAISMNPDARLEIEDDAADMWIRYLIRSDVGISVAALAHRRVPLVFCVPDQMCFLMTHQLLVIPVSDLSSKVFFGSRATIDSAFGVKTTEAVDWHRFSPLDLWYATV